MTSTTLLTARDARWVVEQAIRAPSVHNTQPWRFRWVGDTLELRGDTRRGLTVADPDGRELVLSCGAALFNLRLALLKLGLLGDVVVVPDPADPRLLARVAVHPGQPADAETRRLYAALTRRHTHRGRFEDRPLAADLAVRLQQAAEAEGALLLFVSDPGQRRRVLHLARAADRQLASDERARAEVAAWTPPPGSRRRDGIPTTAYAPETATLSDDLPRRDFDLGRHYGQAAPAEQPPGGVAVLVTDRDLEEDWLLAGQALERVLVVAAERGAYAALHSQVVEVGNIRDELRRELCTSGFPQMLLRVGYCADVPPTPRRPVDDVLDLT